jgi:hypothetical protein
MHQGIPLPKREQTICFKKKGLPWMKLYQMGFGAERNSSFSALREALIELTRKFTPEAKRVVTLHLIK